MGHDLKFDNDSIKDDGLNWAISNATHVVACEGMPATYSDASTNKGSGGNRLGMKTVTLTGPSDGSPDGRQLTMPAVTDISVDVTGIFDFQAIIDDTNSALVSVSPQAFGAIIAVDTSTETVTIDGDVSADVGADDDVTIRQSTGNDGTYTVASVTVNASTETEVTLNEDITDATVDGYLIYGAVKLTSGGTTNVGERYQTLHDAD